MIGVMIVPTGIRAEIGGHAGDATPAARMLAGLCDKLIVHPNVVFASDICEMTENMLLVEGSTLDRFLCGDVFLEPVRSNKVLVVANAPVKQEVINSVSAARATLGLDASIVELKTPLVLRGWIDSNGARGEVTGWKELCDQVYEMDFDALAITSKIDVDKQTQLAYLQNGGVNPYGRAEAMASGKIAGHLGKPVAHAPEAAGPDDPLFTFNELVDPRMAAEMVSVSYLHCVLKGLHRAPRISELEDHRSVHMTDVDFMVSPAGCYGPPHEACLAVGIPIIVVAENKTCVEGRMRADTIADTVLVANYWEAAGYVACMKAGVDPLAVRRPLAYTKVVRSD